MRHTMRIRFVSRVSGERSRALPEDFHIVAQWCRIPSNGSEILREFPLIPTFPPLQTIAYLSRFCPIFCFLTDSFPWITQQCLSYQTDAGFETAPGESLQWLMDG